MPQETKPRNIAILGSTGSIGTQALEVIDANPDLFSAALLVAGSNIELLVQQARKFQPDTIVIGEIALLPKLKSALSDTDIKVYGGVDAIVQCVYSEQIDMVLTAMVGYAGLAPTIAAIKAGRPIALANKETLVVAGALIRKLAAEHRAPIIPVDSEHSAIFQCLAGEFHNPIEKIILTASGGPFRGFNRQQLTHVTKAQALKHPNWSMGAKITIDSASMMNKGLEVIEAKWLFEVEADQIEVVVHPQSIVHSLVQFCDGSIKAQLGLPDMKLPIQYALAFPQRISNDFKRFSFVDYPNLTFESPDAETFQNLALAFEALRQGGNLPCVLNAANEIVVQAFLEDRVGFLQMSDIIANTMNLVPKVSDPSMEDYILTDREARRIAAELLS